MLWAILVTVFRKSSRSLFSVCQPDSSAHLINRCIWDDKKEALSHPPIVAKLLLVRVNKEVGPVNIRISHTCSCWMRLFVRQHALKSARASGRTVYTADIWSLVVLKMYCQKLFYLVGFSSGYSSGLVTHNPSTIRLFKHILRGFHVQFNLSSPKPLLLALWGSNTLSF